jgi:transposase
MYPAPSRPAITARPHRYPSNCTDAEWALIGPLLPIPAHQTPTGGRPETHDRRAIVDAIRYLTDNGCKWRALPADFPPWKTVHGFFARWSARGVITWVRDRLRAQVRLNEGRQIEPTAAILDSQSVKADQTVGRNSRGFDAAKKINGRKRHLVVDTLGLLLVVWVTPAAVQDRDAARDVLRRLRVLHPGIAHLWADSGYSGQLIAWARSVWDLTIEIVKKLAGQRTFVVLPRRWVVERTNAWTLQARRNVRDYERRPEHSEAFINWSAITVMTRRLTR